MATKKKTRRKRRTLSGLGATKKRRRKKKTATKGKARRVSRAAAVHKSGKKKGKLKKGCRFTKGDGAICRGSTTTRRKRKSSKRKSSKRKSSKRKGSSKKKAGHIYSGNPKRSSAFKKGKGGRRVLKKGCRKITSGKNRGKVRCRRKVSRSRRKAA